MMSTSTITNFRRTNIKGMQKVKTHFKEKLTKRNYLIYLVSSFPFCTSYVYDLQKFL